MVGFPPGGGNDVVARIVAASLVARAGHCREQALYLEAGSGINCGGRVLFRNDIARYAKIVKAAGIRLD